MNKLAIIDTIYLQTAALTHSIQCIPLGKSTLALDLHRYSSEIEDFLLSLNRLSKVDGKAAFPLGQSDSIFKIVHRVSKTKLTVKKNAQMSVVMNSWGKFPPDKSTTNSCAPICPAKSMPEL